MARRFSFFKWARGDASEPGRDFRRLLILLGCVIGLVVVVLMVRAFIWKGGFYGEHPHEVGPHGGIVVAIDHEDPHYHAEVLVKKSGRIHLFLFGKETRDIVEVREQLLIGRVRRHGDVETTSLILRPAGKPGDAKTKTSQFVGRLSPQLLEYDLSVSIEKIEIEGRSFSFQFALQERPGAKKQAIESERSVIFTPGGRYTAADVAVAGKTLPWDRFQSVKVVHDLRPNAGDILCPVTRAKADDRISWHVNGNRYLFCCPACILEFVEWAHSNPDNLIEPAQLKPETCR